MGSHQFGAFSRKHLSFTVRKPSEWVMCFDRAFPSPAQPHLPSVPHPPTLKAAVPHLCNPSPTFFHPRNIANPPQLCYAIGID